MGELDVKISFAAKQSESLKGNKRFCRQVRGTNVFTEIRMSSSF